MRIPRPVRNGLSRFIPEKEVSVGVNINPAGFKVGTNLTPNILIRKCNLFFFGINSFYHRSLVKLF